MQERRRLPDGFLLMLLSHHFVVAFLVLTTFVVEPAVYNFMQTQKERKPCKIKAFEACRKISEKILKLVLTIIGEDDIVYIVAGDTNETKQHRSKDSLQKNTAR